MRFTKTSFTLLLLFIVGVVSAQKINSEKSKISFEIDGMMWSTVEGEIKGMKGDVLFDANNLALSYFRVCVDPSTVNTDNEKRDAHLIDPDFFTVKLYPKICFNSSSITKTKDGYFTKGKLTMLKVTKEVAITFTVKQEAASKILIGKLKVNRLDYGLAAESYSSTSKVGETAEVTITCVLLD